MKLIDTMNGPVWVVWAVGILCAAISLLLLSGRGSWLIAGYNTASKKEKEKYDEKKLCLVMVVLCNTICKKKKGNENSHDKA